MRHEQRQNLTIDKAVSSHDRRRHTHIERGGTDDVNGYKEDEP